MLMAASTSHSSRPSSSASTLHPTWDVFLSFRGKDTRDSFTDFLYHSLDRNGIRTFRDDPELRSGEVISSALLQAIHESKIYVVVLSKNYASSQYCLDELVEILGCYESLDRLVVPVFYYIDPSVVKYQTGSFGEAFLKHEKRLDRDRVDKWLKCLDWLFLFFTTLTHRSSSTRQEVSITHESHDTRYEKGRLDRWRHALNQMGKFSGYHVRENMSQSDVINEIVDRVLHEVNPVTLDVAKYQVGLDSRVKDLETSLSSVTARVIRFGIYGMGGVGKTTLAKAVYNQNYSHFEGSCFLENVREASQTREGIACLQQKLVNNVLKRKDITIDNADRGIEWIRARICSKKILVVIDDLDSRITLDFIEGPFALGSTIIITTRHEDFLDSIDVEARYKVNELGDVESRLLFCQHAFGGDNKIPDTFSNLSKEILKRAGGLPLALQVCGSALHKKSEEGWRCFIDELRRVSIADVEKILFISFNALVDPMLKDIFLDIACFFIGYKQVEAVKILETCYTSVNYNIEKLKKRCLLTINDKRFMMHDLLMDMSRRIACNNSPDAPENHSRLWVPEIILKVLEEKKGREAIEGIIPPSNFDFRGKKSKGKHFAAETFKRMSKLRFLYLQNVNLTGSFEQTFKNLRWLCWKSCPLECLPPDFYPQKLVCLALSGSKLRTMWELNTVFENLKTLDMSYSRYLTTASGFERLPCLETLSFKDCEWLEEVHILTGSLLRLVSLNLGGCENLKSLPDNICNLRALKSLNINGCTTLITIPLNFGNIESLAELNANGLNICKLPDSIGRLSKLIDLNLSYCQNLITLPDTICNLRSLKILDIGWCRNLEALPKELGNLESLVELKAQGIIVSELPNSIGSLSELVLLNMDSCPMLKTLPDTICNLRSLKILNIDRCSSLEALPAELGNLEFLVSFNARELSNIPNLPASIRPIGSLENLMLSSCFNLLSVDGLPSSLKVIRLQGCKAMERLPNLSNLKQLERFDLTNCSGLTEIQGLEELTSIRILNLRGCNLSLLKSIFTKCFFQIYSGFGHQITVFAPSSVFPDWINQSPDWIGKTEFTNDTQSTFPHWTSNYLGSRMILYMPLNRSHNFLAMILCSKFSRNGTAVSSVETATNSFTWSFEFETSPVDGNKDFSCMEIVPRKLFSVTDDDSNIVFDTRLNFYDGFAKSEGSEILGIHLLYKLERHSSKRLKHL